MDNSKRKFRSKRRSKRQAPKNRYLLAAQRAVENGTEISTNDGMPANLAAQPGTSKYKLETSDSAKQLLEDSLEVEVEEKVNGFRFIDIEILQTALQNAALCKFCKHGFLSIVENSEKPKMGMANHWLLQCSNNLCGKSCAFYTSRKCGRGFEMNRRLVLGMSTIGKGYNALVLLSSDLNVPNPMNAETFQDNFEVIRDATELEAKDSMYRAAVEEHTVCGADVNNVVNCRVMFDGTWRKRGRSSLQGGVTAISAATGKCIDYEPLNKVCKGSQKGKRYDKDSVEYEEWKANHSSKCTINYTGSAPSMEPVGIQRIYSRSVFNNKLRYTGYIGDGDTKFFNNVKDSKPYGDDIEIQKIECVAAFRKGWVQH